MFWKRKSKRSFKCSVCGEEHDEWPALAFTWPNAYFELSDQDREAIGNASEDFCVIAYKDQTDRFIRVVLKQKVNDSNQDLDYGVWVSLSEKSYLDYKANFKNPKHEAQYFGWLHNRIPEYENTLNIPTTVITKYGNERPEIFPHEDYNHQFVTDYYNGISKEEAEERIHRMMVNAG